MFKLNFANTVWRFYLVMLIGIIAVYTHQSWLIFVVFAVAVSAILGYQFNWGGTKRTGKVIEMPEAERAPKKQAV